MAWIRKPSCVGCTAPRSAAARTPRTDHNSMLSEDFGSSDPVDVARRAACAPGAAEPPPAASPLPHGAEAGDTQSAINFALQSELSADDAVAILSAKQSADVVRPN